jgi:lysophospholipase L1-like esterase
MRRLGARVALALSALVVCLLVLEVAARLLGAVSPPLTERDPVVGQRLVRNFTGAVYDAEARRVVHVRTDREGFRGPDRPFEKPAGVRRVAILGDSMIAALGVEEDQTLVARLERLLNRPSPSAERWEVLNFGVPGASTGQELALWRTTVKRYQPDVVLCAFFVGNDLADNSRRLSSNPRVYFELDAAGRLVQVPMSAAKTGLSAWLNRHSRLYLWQKEAVRRARYAWLKQAGQLEAGHWIYATQEPPDVAEAWRLTGTLLAEMANEVRQAGARFGVVLIPTAQQVYPESMRKAVAVAGTSTRFDADYPDQRLARLCQSAGVPLLSMTADFRQAAPSRSLSTADEWLFLHGEGHFNERGNQLAAEAVCRWMTAGNPPPASIGTRPGPATR